MRLIHQQERIRFYKDYFYTQQKTQKIITRNIYKTDSGIYVVKYNKQFYSVYLSDCGYGWRWYLGTIIER